MRILLGATSFLLLTLCLVGGVQSHIDVRVPSSALEALVLYQRASRSGNLYQVQAALGWMENNFEAVLDNVYLVYLDDALLNRILGQPWPVDEIKVFRTIKFLVENSRSRLSTLGSPNVSNNSTNDTNSTPVDASSLEANYNVTTEAPIDANQTSLNKLSLPRLTNFWRRHSPNLLISNLYLGSLTPEQIQDEVIPSGLITCNEAAETLVRRVENKVLPGMQRTNPAVGRVVLNENVVREDLNARILNRYLYLSPSCHGTNPLLPARSYPWSYSESTCFVRISVGTDLTVQLNAKYLINYVRVRSGYSNRCQVKILASSDRESWQQVATISHTYSLDSSSFSTQLARYIQLRVVSCESTRSNTTRAAFEVQAFEVLFMG